MSGGMVSPIVSKFDQLRGQVSFYCQRVGYPSYCQLFAEVFHILYPDPSDDEPDHKTVRAFHFDDYQGDGMLRIWSRDRSICWESVVIYGSCSVCDALECATNLSGGDRAQAMFRIVLSMIQELREFQNV